MAREPVRELRSEALDTTHQRLSDKPGVDVNPFGGSVEAEVLHSDGRVENLGPPVHVGDELVHPSGWGVHPYRVPRGPYSQLGHGRRSTVT